jgi:hypothetical protein
MERPRSFRQVAEILYGKRLNYERIADATAYPEPFIRALFEAHASRDHIQARPHPQSDTSTAVRIGGRSELLSFPPKR